MLGYYRNALNFVFFNEAMILCSLLSQGVHNAWSQGMPLDELRKRSIYLAGVLKREEVLKEYLSETNHKLFDKLIAFMVHERMIEVSD